MKTVFIKTHGCQMNDYDSARMLDLLKATHQVTQVNDPEQADLLLLNTCSIREKAQEKVFSELGRWRAIKAKRPHVLIGVAGCVASQEGDAIIRRAPYVDLVFGPQTLHRLPALIKARSAQAKAVVDIAFPEIEKFDHLPRPHASGPAAYVSIMEGCSKYCTYCIVPYTRGKEVSRPFDDVIGEVASLVAQGVKEITFLGQNVNAYQGPMHDGSMADLGLLIQYASEFEELARIRFTTSHPVNFSDTLIQAYDVCPKLVNQLHLPVQSGSDAILGRMKRGHTALEYGAKIRKLREVRPDISITSDFIVGFPGETEADFEATLALVAKIGFDQSFSFIYSKRPGTPAATLPDDVPQAVKKQRLQRLQAQLQTQAQGYSQAMVGQNYPVLVTGPAKRGEGQLQGRTENNRIVNFPGTPDLVGQIVNLNISAALPNSLAGKLLD